MNAPTIAGRDEFRTISLVGFVHGISHFYHLLFPALYPWLMREFNLNYTQVGAAMTVFFVISGVGQSLAGIVVDRLGPRQVLLGGIALLAAASLTLGLAQHYVMVLLAGALAGLGNSVFHPADFTLLNHRISQGRLGHAFSVHGLTGTLGWALAPVSMAFIAATGGWRLAAILATGMALVGWLALAFLMSSEDEIDHHAATDGGPEGPTAGGVLDFLKVPAVWLCFAFFLLTAMALGVLQSYLSPVLGHLFSFPVATAATALTAYMIGSAAGTVPGGFLASRAGQRDGVIALSLAGGAFMLLGVSLGWIPETAVVPVLAAVGFAVGIAGPSRDLLVRQAATARFGRAAFGRIYGFVYSGMDVGMALAPLLFGPMLDNEWFRPVLIGVSFLQALAVVTVLAIGKMFHGTQ